MRTNWFDYFKILIIIFGLKLMINIKTSNIQRSGPFHAKTLAVKYELLL